MIFQKLNPCGREKNQFSGNIPLHVDHIDGNAGNTTPKNVRLICPNCHSLTEYFGNIGSRKSARQRKTRYAPM